MYEEIAPSGIKVISEIPFPEPRWWDIWYLHPFWSYHSWVSRIVQDFGFFPGWTKWFKR